VELHSLGDVFHFVAEHPGEWNDIKLMAVEVAPTAVAAAAATSAAVATTAAGAIPTTAANINVKAEMQGAYSSPEELYAKLERVSPYTGCGMLRAATRAINTSSSSSSSSSRVR